MPTKYHLIRNKAGKITGLETNQTGHDLLDNPRLNKCGAFTQEERETFELIGKLPQQIETIEEQVEKTYAHYQTQGDDLTKNLYLNALHDRNETLFYC